MGVSASTGRSPVPAIVGSIVVGFILSIALAYVVAPDGSEALVTGSGLLAWGAGWALMASLTTRFSGQPQRWLFVPAGAFAAVGLVLIVLQPGMGVMDLLAFAWPVAVAVLAVWIFMQARRQVRGAGRWIIEAMAVVLVVLSVAGLVVRLSPSAEHLGPGQRYDVGGRSLYLECEGSGSPVVILQAGAGGDSTAWHTVQPAIAEKTTVCSYDRAGRGASDNPRAPQDASAIATDLHALLAAADLTGPYVFVGHSSGGPYLRVYADAYPEDVAGLVLIDPQPATAFTALPEYPAIYDYLKLSGGLAPSVARIGLLGPLFGVSPSEATPAVAASYRDEIRMLPASLEEAAKVTSVGSVPLIIVSAGAGQQRGWDAAQEAQVSLSTNAAHRTVQSATHESLLEADSAASIQAILDVLAAVASGTPVG
jgi:pimeloyl-ACP methyl ester carboxylesterase